MGIEKFLFQYGKIEKRKGGEKIMAEMKEGSGLGERIGSMVKQVGRGIERRIKVGLVGEDLAPELVAYQKKVLEGEVPEILSEEEAERRGRADFVFGGSGDFLRITSLQEDGSVRAWIVRVDEKTRKPKLEYEGHFRSDGRDFEPTIASPQPGAVKKRFIPKDKLGRS